MIRLPELIPALIELVLEYIAERGYLQVGPCIEEVHCCSGTSSPASNKARLYRIAVGSPRKKGRQLNLFLLRLPGTG